MKKEHIEIVRKEWPNLRKLEEEGYSNIDLPKSSMMAINQWLNQQTEYLSYYFNTYSDIREDFIIMKVKQFILDMKNMIGLALRLGAKEGEEMQKFYFPTYFLIFDISPEKRELKTTEEFFNAGKEHKLELGEDKADRKLTEKEKKSRKKTPGKE